MPAPLASAAVAGRTALDKASHGLVPVAAVHEQGGIVFVTQDAPLSDGPLSALAVGDVDIEPTGHDETFWVTDSARNDLALEDALSNLGFAARPIAGGGGLKLFGLAGYVQRDDERLARAPGSLTGVIGAAPAPFDL